MATRFCIHRRREWRDTPRHASRPDFLLELVRADVLAYPRAGVRVAVAQIDDELIGEWVGQTSQPSPSRVCIPSFSLFCWVHPAESRLIRVRSGGLELEVVFS